MEHEDLTTLEQAGLTASQATIYLTLLKIGQTKIGTIIEKTKLQSSVVHNNVNKLIEEGLITFITIGKIRHYKTTEPKVFLNYLDKKKDEIEKQKKEISKILPRLELLKEETKKKTEIEVYKGFKGFRTAFIEQYENLEEGGAVEFIGIPSPFQQDEELQQMFKITNMIVSRKNNSMKGLGTPDMKDIWTKFYKDDKMYSFRYSKEEFPWGLTIFKDTILLAMWGDEPILIKIKNKNFRDYAKKYFERKWKNAKS